MVNRQKSKCQLRLEARSRASCAPTSASLDPQLLAAELQSRIARANEVRAVHTRQLAARARARVQHAQEVARVMRIKRHEESRRCRQSSILKMAEAVRRRHELLEQLQLQCKQRANLIKEKVELVRASQSDRVDRARRTLADQLDDATRRRQEQTEQRVRRLMKRRHNAKYRATSVKYIQRWFRRHVVYHQTVKAWREVQQDIRKVTFCWNQMKTASFEDCMNLLQQHPVVEAAQRLVKVLMADTRTNTTDSKPAVEKFLGYDNKTLLLCSQGGRSYRVLLMAGMISCHPVDIMGYNPCKRLYYAANAILLTMEKLTLSLAASNGCQRSQEFTQRVTELAARFLFYTETFAYWKKQDANQLAVELLTSYRELIIVHRKYKMQAQQAKNRVDGVSELLRQTQGQLMQLQRALERLLGKNGAKRRVMELEQSLRQEDRVDNALVNSNGKSIKEGDNNRLSSGEGDTASSLPMNVDHDSGQDKKGDKDDNMWGVNVVDDDASGAIPPNVNQALLADRKLVHELIINPRFQIQRDKDVEASAAAIVSKQSIAAMTVRVREAMTKAFWDRVIASNDIETLLACMEKLCTTFRDALGGGTAVGSGVALSTLSDQVDIALHPDKFRELVQDPMRNLHAIQARCLSVLDAIERAEAPARAASTRLFRSDWAQRGAVDAMASVQLLVAFLAFALDKVDELRVDVLNAHLGLLGVFLQQYGVEYEQKQLYSRLSESKNSMDMNFAMTRKWLETEMEAYLTRPDVDDLERACLVRHDGGAFKRFMRASIWALVVRHIDDTPSRIWPETFELDVERIRACRDALDRIAVVSSLLALVQDYVARRSLATPAGFVNAVGNQLSRLLQSPGITGVQVAAQAFQVVREFESSDGENRQQELQVLEKQLINSFAPNNPVFKLFFSRASRAFEVTLQQGNAMDNLHSSLVPFATEISETTLMLRRLAQHNENVYVSLYNNIIKRLVPPPV
ncbi:unnamed protein product [Peronospora belbahrii]|uniref:T-complex 11 n=1 Tax=Peronospora belbahrii TaxID=622444 RepID=A0AAU9KRU0_9STRA|nr:unnamed protein product [Peronospora belbahrii]CAH0519775.1 unnamed protein product [Peronospora belbahrii]